MLDSHGVGVTEKAPPCAQQGPQSKDEEETEEQQPLQGRDVCRGGFQN